MPPRISRFLWSRRKWQEKYRANGKLFCARRCDTPICSLEWFSRNFLLAKLDGSFATLALPTKLKLSSRNCSQVSFLHLRKTRNNTSNSLGKYVAPTTNCKSGNATCTISRNCNCAEDGVTTPIESQITIIRYYTC